MRLLADYMFEHVRYPSDTTQGSWAIEVEYKPWKDKGDFYDCHDHFDCATINDYYKWYCLFRRRPWETWLEYSTRRDELVKAVDIQKDIILDERIMGTYHSKKRKRTYYPDDTHSSFVN